MSFDLEPSNYNINEMEDLFQLNRPYSKIHIDESKRKIENNIANDSNINQNKRIKIMDFLTKISDLLIKNTNEHVESVLTMGEVIKVSNDDSGKTVSSVHVPTGEMNPINYKTIQRVINIDSRFRDNYYGVDSNDLHINLPFTINNVISMQLSSAYIPKTFYNISQELGNNRLQIELNYASKSDDANHLIGIRTFSFDNFKDKFTNVNSSASKKRPTIILNPYVSYNTTTDTYNQITIIFNEPLRYELLFRDEADNTFTKDEFKKYFTVRDKTTNNIIPISSCLHLNKTILDKVEDSKFFDGTKVSKTGLLERLTFEMEDPTNLKDVTIQYNNDKLSTYTNVDGQGKDNVDINSNSNTTKYNIYTNQFLANDWGYELNTFAPIDVTNNDDSSPYASFAHATLPYKYTYYYEWDNNSKRHFHIYFMNELKIPDDVVIHEGNDYFNYRKNSNNITNSIYKTGDNSFFKNAVIDITCLKDFFTVKQTETGTDINNGNVSNDNITKVLIIYKYYVLDNSKPKLIDNKNNIVKSYINFEYFDDDGTGNKNIANELYEITMKDIDYESIINFKIPDGLYTNETLGRKINDINLQYKDSILDVDYTYDIDSKKSIFKMKKDINFTLRTCIDENNNEDNSITLPLTLGWILGFRSSKYESQLIYNNDTGVYDSSSIVISEGCCDTNKMQYVYISVDDFNNNSNNYYKSAFSGSLLGNNILAKLINDDDNGKTSICSDVFTTSNQNGLRKRSYFGPVNIQKLHIQLLDEYGRLVNLNHNDWSCSLTFEVLYKQ